MAGRDQAASRRRHSLALVIAAGFGAAMAGNAAHAADNGDYHSVKTVTWDLDGGGPNSGLYNYLDHVFAQDAHVDKPDHKDNQDQSGAEFRRELADYLKPNGKHSNADIHTTKHNYTDLINFDQMGGDQKFGPFSHTAKSKHPTSSASVLIEYAQPVDHDPKKGQAKITLDGTAKNLEFPDKPRIDETTYAESAAGTTVILKGKISAAEVVNGKGPVKQLKNLIGKSGVHSEAVGIAMDGGAQYANANYSDPLSLTLTDSVTGALLARQTLFSLIWSTSGTAGVDYDPSSGLELSVDRGGDALVEFDTPGSWVLNPIDGTAEVANGSFHATGDLANLPWQVSTVGGVTTASLGPSELSLDLTFNIQPTDLGTPANDITATLEVDDSAFSSAYATSVPEPASLLQAGAGLGLVGGCLLARRRARAADAAPGV